MAGFLFLGIAYGIFMNAAGFSPIYPIVMSLTIFAGSMEFVAADLLLNAFDPLGAFLMTLMVNARHLFYGISMLDQYKGTGLKKLYLIFGMCDESFSINCTALVPPQIDKGWFYFFVTLLNHLYWVLGATMGAVFGSLIQLNLEGLDFVMTALMVVLFLEQLLKNRRYGVGIIGLASTLLCRFLFGTDRFILPAMALTLLLLTLLRNPIEKAGEPQ